MNTKKGKNILCFYCGNQIYRKISAINKLNNFCSFNCYSKNKICLYSNIIRYKQSSFEDYVKLVGQIMTQDNNPNLKGLKSYDIETNSKKGFVLETSVSAPDKESKVIDVFIDYSWPVLVQINISGENIEISELENIYNKLIPTFKFIK